MRNENILLKLPHGLRVRDIKWLSIWCQRFTVNYGEVYVPADVEVPRPAALASLSNPRGRLGSGRITILDTETLYIPRLSLVVMEPGYHFWTGNSSYGEPDGSGRMVANEMARFDDLESYNGKDVFLTLPKDVTVYDVSYISVFNPERGDNVGHVSFNVTGRRIPPALGQTKKPGWWFDMPIYPSGGGPGGSGGRGRGGGGSGAAGGRGRDRGTWGTGGGGGGRGRDRDRWGSGAGGRGGGYSPGGRTTGMTNPGSTTSGGGNYGVTTSVGGGGGIRGGQQGGRNDPEM